VTFEWLEGRPAAPDPLPVDEWRSLRTDDGVEFDREIEVDASTISPQVTWGTTPGMVAPVTGEVPEPRTEGEERALRYMDLAPGRLLHVPGDEPGHTEPGRALRVDLQPQLRGPAGARRPDPPRLAGDGGRGRGRGPLRGHPRLGAGDRLMEPIQVIEGGVTALLRDDVDTDQIMPKQFLKRVERTGYGEFLFYDWAKEPGCELPHNPILATGRNFGCGSSREHAPWG